MQIANALQITLHIYISNCNMNLLQTICTITRHMTEDIDVDICAIVTFATVAALVVCFVTVPLPPSPSHNPRPDTPHLHYKEIL